MKLTIQKLKVEAVQRDFPITNRVPGWYFRLFEQSAGVWRVDGTDLWGRTVNDVGTDENHVLDSCIEMAGDINKQLAPKSR